MSKEKKSHKIWPLKVYSNLNLKEYYLIWNAQSPKFDTLIIKIVVFLLSWMIYTFKEGIWIERPKRLLTLVSDVCLYVFEHTKWCQTMEFHNEFGSSSPTINVILFLTVK